MDRVVAGGGGGERLDDEVFAVSDGAELGAFRVVEFFAQCP